MKYLFFIFIASILISCCPQIKTSQVIKIDTIINVRYDTISINSIPRIVPIRDTIIQIKPFMAITDTVIRYKTKTSWKYDTIHFETIVNSAQDIKHNLLLKGSADTSMTIHKSTINYQEKKPTFLENLWNTLLYLAVLFIGSLLGFFISKLKG